MKAAPHQQRVLDEKRDLDTKIAKLAEFMRGELFDNLPFAERMLMTRQAAHMERYATVLGERIALWGLS